MPETVGRYRILNPLGRGAMGLVYLAEDPTLGRRVAIKMVDFSVEEDSEREFLRGRLLRDAKAAAILSHPSIVRVHDILEEGQAAYLVMEYVDGETLAALLKRVPVPDRALILRVLSETAAALDYTHGKGVVHRDIKPGNIMLDSTGAVKILDFGIARINDSRTTTPTGMVMGTVEYMAPEQIKGEPLDGRADQYSLAAVAYQMLAGGTLFGQHTLATLTYKTVNEMPPSVRTRNAALPESVDEVLKQALAKAPSERFPTCGLFVEALGLALAGRTVVGLHLPPTDAVTVATQIPRPPRRGVAGWIVAACCAVALAGGLAAWHPWTRGGSASGGAPSGATSSSQPPAQPANQGSTAPPAVAPAKPPSAPAPGATASPVTTPPAHSAENPEKAEKIEKPERRETADRPEKSEEPPAVSNDSEGLETGGGALPAGLDTAYKRGQEQLKAGDYQAAIESFSTTISHRPRAFRAFHNRGYAYQMLQQNDAAIRDYSEAIRLAPNEAGGSYTGRGVCLARLRRDDEAFADFNRALEMHPNSVPALNGLGGIYLRRGQYGQAIREFNMAIQMNPGFEPAYSGRARARRATGDVAGADADTRQSKALLAAKAAKSQ